MVTHLAELVTGEAKDFKVFEIPLQCIQSVVLGGGPSEPRHVDNQQHLVYTSNNCSYGLPTLLYISICLYRLTYYHRRISCFKNMIQSFFLIS